MLPRPCREGDQFGGVAMVRCRGSDRVLTRIDHVMICVPDLQQGIVAYTRLGFRVHPGGVHPGQGTHNAIAFHQDVIDQMRSDAGLPPIDVSRFRIHPPGQAPAAPATPAPAASGQGWRVIQVH